VPLAKNDDNGVWSYVLANTPLSGDDEIEYWIYGEMYGVGYFSNDIIKFRGEWIYLAFGGDWLDARFRLAAG
jgi:hypothetical protein